MKTEQKADCRAFHSFLEDLQAQSWLTPEQRWWTRYLFHFADIRNIVSILKDNELLCRSEAIKKSGFVHSTSSQILDQTDAHWKDHVRFYFRPRTPTIWHVEGFRPAEALVRSPFPDAHCPIPIYLLFDLEEVICRADFVFTHGSLARSGVPVYTRAEDFSKTPFDLVYHDSWIDPFERDRIVFHRQAEVAVPNRIKLDTLRYICCRSQAEFETLKHLLPDEIWNYWRSKIVVRSDYNLFNRKRGFVDQVLLSTSQIFFRFNTCDSEDDRGPFQAKVTIYETQSSTNFGWHRDDFHFLPGESLDLNLSNLNYPDDYTVTLTLDGHLAYQNRYQAYDIPF